jgi:transcriptional regulator with XRE-family HTH domain
VADPSAKNVDPIVVELRRIRIESGTKQKDIADAIQIGHSVMSAYENGACPPQIDTVRDWATVLGRSLQLVDPDGPVAQPVRSGVRLTKYQTALAMGMLLAEASRTRGRSESVAADLEQIADILARSLV